MAAESKDVSVYGEWVGSLNGYQNAEIRSRVMGYLRTRNYEEGSTVKQGDLLFEIDKRPFEAALAEAKSQLEQGKSVQIASQADYNRNKELFAKKVISEEEFTNKTQTNVANIANVAALSAAVEEAQLNLGFCDIKSPLNGIAGNSQAQIGDLVGQGTNSTLTSVSTVDPIKVLFPVSEERYLKAADRILEILKKPLEEREATFEVILTNGEIFENKGRLYSVDRQVTESTGTILVTAVVKNPGGLLRPGQFAKARVLTRELKDAVVVPQRAISEVQGSYQIWVIGSDNKAEIRVVNVGPRTGSNWVVESGLKSGEKIVVEGFQKIRAGALVSPKPWTPPATPAPATPSTLAFAPVPRSQSSHRTGSE